MGDCVSDAKGLIPAGNSLEGPLDAAAKNLVPQKRGQAWSLTRESRQPHAMPESEPKGPQILPYSRRLATSQDQITNSFQHKQSWIAFSPSALFRVSSCLPFSVLCVAMAAPHTFNPPLNYLLTIKLIPLSAGLALLGKLLAGAL